ncbi:MAG: DUF86 domain-containing protein [Clostridia bacterium]|nr:DUF86 domain-containing protein [Clostridia bacterium]
MKDKDKIILEKMIKYINELKGFILGYDNDMFNNDRKTINACVFDLSQIGELAGKVSEELITENPQIEWRGIKSLRNRIVHDYDGINLNMIWGFLTEELEELEMQLKEIQNN